MFRPSDALLGFAAVCGVATAVALSANPLNEALVESIAAEQFGPQTLCTQLPRGDWRCAEPMGHGPRCGDEGAARDGRAHPPVPVS